ncbi:MAG: 3-hydroxyacyl-CoA dehydrogenase [Pseudomonadota bacterium]|nr:3-hydroxyacyl-CoA dehydrogenase/enoyl-CoA hydratase family protein [Pseudomonadota bacterium]QKK06480.1 MAG: 3-hydroxyacyl-CoA dehydrogenase [Pseudomonadota bacterium]
MEIKKVAVIGAGVMGSGIAAQIANAGTEVLLLDIVPKDAADRDILAKSAIEKMLKTDPAPLMHPKNARRIHAGNTEDHLKDIAGCDWIVEAVLENLDIKQKLYKRIEEFRKPTAVISSNTSSIPLHLLTEGRSDSFKKHFLITHFFNPPRYMRLLELVTSGETDPAVTKRIFAFGDAALGKGIVPCNDTPGFIANRIGAFWLQAGMNEAFNLGVSVEEADAVMSRPVGIPKTGIFGLLDLVGIDLMPHLAKSLLSTLPATDNYAAIHRDFDLIDKMIADGYTGRKGKGGFYRLNKAGGKKVKESINLKTGDYALSEKAAPPALEAFKKDGLRGLVSSTDKAGQYAWQVLSQTLCYAADLVPEIADNIFAVDQAMKLGYNWSKGPFELMDALGTAWLVEKLAEEDRDIPALLKDIHGKNFYKTKDGVLHYFGIDDQYHPVERAKGVLLLEDIKRKSSPVHKNDSAALWDIGDDVLCLEFTAKMNALDLDVMAMIHAAIEQISSSDTDYKALVVYNEGTNFSAGANLSKALAVVDEGNWPAIESLITEGQRAYRALKFAPFPVIGAPAGLALGGGCEILLHCDGIEAYAETYCGLVEVGVGIIPGWGGCKEMLLRHHHKRKAGGPVPPIAAAFETIGLAKVAKSAAEAKQLLFLKDSDGITMNRDRLLANAKARALELAKHYTAPEGEELRLPGPAGQLALMMAVNGLAHAGRATPHDVTVSEALTEVLSGGKDGDVTQTLTEEDLLALELQGFMRLVKTPETRARIDHMLKTGKALRN